MENENKIYETDPSKIFVEECIPMIDIYGSTLYVTYNKTKSKLTFRIMSRNAEFIMSGNMNWQGVIEEFELDSYVGELYTFVRYLQLINLVYRKANQLGFSYIQTINEDTIENLFKEVITNE